MKYKKLICKIFGHKFINDDIGSWTYYDYGQAFVPNKVKCKRCYKQDIIIKKII